MNAEKAKVPTEFNRWDILNAYYMFGTLWHSGQFSKEYAMLCRVLRVYTPSDSDSRLENMTDNARAIYDNLVYGIGEDPYSDTSQIVPDYEPCGECGFDHSYEPKESSSWHEKNDSSVDERDFLSASDYYET